MTLLDSCPGQLEPDHIDWFREHGYLAFRELLIQSEVDVACSALTELAAFADRIPGLLAETEPGHRPETREPESRLRKLMHWRGHHPALAALAAGHPRLQPCVESLLGSDVECFQDMALIKPPHIGSEKPWHQDAAYFDVVPLDAVIGVWIALDAATVDNGCMHVVPGVHRDGPRRHVLAPVLVPRSDDGALGSSEHKDCQIEGFAPDGAVPIPLPPGGVLFFSSLLPHQTPPNRSDQRRRALQLHFRLGNSCQVDRATYDGVFVDAEGRPASCAAASRG